MMELVNTRVKLQNGCNYGDWLIEKSRQDSVVVHEVTSRLSEVSKPVDDASRKLSMFKTELEKQLMQQRDFVGRIDDLAEKISKTEDQINKIRPVSAKYPTARGQHEDFKPLFREVQNLRKVHETVMQEKEKIERGSGDMVEKETPENALQEAVKKAGDLDRRWQTLWDTMTKYHVQITSVLPFEELHHYSVLRFVPWLEDMEKKVKQIQKAPTQRPDEFEETKRNIKVGTFVCVLLLVSLFYSSCK